MEPTLANLRRQIRILQANAEDLTNLYGALNKLPIDAGKDMGEGDLTALVAMLRDVESACTAINNRAYNAQN